MPGHRVAIVGTGFGVRVQLPAFRRAGFEVVSLTGTNLQKTETLAAANDVPHAFVDLVDALRTGEPDLVSIASPPNHHCTGTIAVLEAGHHCLVEKPIAVNAAEATRMAAAAQASDRITVLNHELRALPNRREAKRRLDAGELGRPLSARVLFTSHGRGRPGVRWNWWARKNDGGGILGAIGSHITDMLVWWLGDVVEANARLTTSIPGLPDEAGELRRVETDDGADMLLRFENGCVANVSMTTVAHRYEGMRWEIHGTEGSLWIEPDGRLLVAARHDDERTDVSQPELLSAEDEIDGTHWARGFVILARDLARSLDSRQPIDYAATFADGLSTQRILDAARTSAETGKTVTVHPARRRSG